jgi:hypothetical protein
MTGCELCEIVFHQKNFIFKKCQRVKNSTEYKLSVKNFIASPIRKRRNTLPIKKLIVVLNLQKNSCCKH